MSRELKAVAPAGIEASWGFDAARLSSVTEWVTIDVLRHSTVWPARIWTVSGWKLEGQEGKSAGQPAAQPMKISKHYEFADFLGAMAFVDRMAALAEREGHHPDFCVHYSRVDVTLWTHAARGLTENDFILASKLDVIVS